MTTALDTAMPTAPVGSPAIVARDRAQLVVLAYESGLMASRDC